MTMRRTRKALRDSEAATTYVVPVPTIDAEEAARWEATAKTCSKLLAHAEEREQAMAVAVQEARDMLADIADEWVLGPESQPRLLSYISHLDTVLAPYKVVTE